MCKKKGAVYRKKRNHPEFGDVLRYFVIGDWLPAPECTIKKEVAQNLLMYFRYFVLCWSNGRNFCGTFHYFKKTFLFLEWERGGVGGWRDNDAGCANALVK